jgi:hypothetical protein
MENGIPGSLFITRTTAAMAVGSNLDEGPENSSYAIVGQKRAGSPARRLIIRTTATATGSSMEGPENETKTMEDEVPARQFIIRTRAAMNVWSDSDKGPESRSYTIVGQKRAGSPAQRLIIRTTATATGSSTEGPENETITMEDEVPARQFITRTTAATNVGSDSDESPESRSYATVGQKKAGSTAQRLNIRPTAAAVGRVFQTRVKRTGQMQSQNREEQAFRPGGSS